MKQIQFICTQCVVNKYGPITPSRGEFDIDLDHYPVSEVRDTPVYDVICANGHSFRAILQKEKFELLFDWGVYAFVDGYYREAVTSFASSLERFYEFCIYALTSHRVASDEFEKAWRSLKYSERQFGAFSLLYLQATRKACPVPKVKDVELRNDVVHNGKFPDRDEALRYGGMVRSSITECIVRIGENRGDVLIRAYNDRFEKYRKESDFRGVAITSTVIDIQFGPHFTERDYRNGSLEEVIERIRKQEV